MPRIAISFDYDSPTGYRESFHIQDMPPDADQRGTAALLRVLADFGVRATFGVVGAVALDGAAPEHCPDQIREVHAAGHEIASHSMRHRFLPSMTSAELFDDVATSKQVLESCIGAQVGGFIPPFNRPMHFPSRGSFSVSEVFGMHGRGRGRQSVGRMLQTLGRAGFGWCRVSYESKLSQLLRACRGIREEPLMQPFVLHEVVAIPLHCTGFDEASSSAVRRSLDSDRILAIYGHPNQALGENKQSAYSLSRFFQEWDRQRARGEVQFHTMGEIDALVRAGTGRTRIDSRAERGISQ